MKKNNSKKSSPRFVVTRPVGHLDSFPSPSPHPFEVVFTTEEFTCLCPLTGQPDFAHLTLRYQPNKRCLESKSLKLYLWSFRDRGAFHEAVTNEILEACFRAVKPYWMRLDGDFLIRGGIRTVIIAERGKKK